MFVSGIQCFIISHILLFLRDLCCCKLNFAAMVFLPSRPNFGALSCCVCFCNHKLLEAKKTPWLSRLTSVWHVPLSLCGTTPTQPNPYELLSKVLCRQNGTIRFIGPWFSSLVCIITCDPRNLESLLKAKFSNFLKGPYFQDTVRDLLGDGIFNADHDKCQSQRKMASFEFQLAKFWKLTVDSLFELVHGRLLPVLEDSIKHSAPINLQDVLMRLTFDNVCMIVTREQRGSFICP
ncbi:hypothetical protein ACFX15_027948 [Malus domestica]